MAGIAIDSYPCYGSLQPKGIIRAISGCNKQIILIAKGGGGALREQRIRGSHGSWRAPSPGG